MKSNQTLILSFAAILFMIASCRPFIVDDIDLGESPVADFSFEFLPGDSNRIVVSDQSEGAFAYFWEYGGGVGKTPTASFDSVYFKDKGTYSIQLTVSGNGGTSSIVKEVIIPIDDPDACSDERLIFLAGGCESTDSSVWVFSSITGAISIGPTYMSTGWFISQAGDLELTQYDDAWVFYGDGRFYYRNNGQTVDPYNGYQVINYTPPSDATWVLTSGTGQGQRPQITLTPEVSFMGVLDSGPVYDIDLVSETELVIVGEARENAGGWFTLYFVKQ